MGYWGYLTCKETLVPTPVPFAIWKSHIIFRQALEFIRQKNVKKFQSTFVSLKLSSLASHLKLSVQEVEKRLRKMIISGDLSAQICKLEEPEVQSF